LKRNQPCKTEESHYFGSKDWADSQLRYLLQLLGDNSTWNLPHNFYAKRLVSFLILERLRDYGFFWHFKVGSGHFHRWLKRKSWVGSTIEPIEQLREGIPV
jgi:hypothetical protein